MASFQDRLKQIGFSSYEDYLKSEHWKNVKKRYKESKCIQYCYICETKHFLQLHHKTYKRLGNEKLSDFIYLCKNCHTETHKKLKENTDSRINLWNIARKIKGNHSRSNIKKRAKRNIKKLLRRIQNKQILESDIDLVKKLYKKQKRTKDFNL